MPAQVGPRAQTGTAEASSLNQSSAASLDTDTDIHNCGMCKLVVGDDGIGCDRCSVWFHPSEMCMGLSQTSIHIIAESEDSDALLYLCTSCRLKPGTGAWTRTKQKRSNGDLDEGQNQLILQLFQTVKGLCAEVAGLSEKIKTAFSLGSASAGISQQTSSDNRSYSEALAGRQTTRQGQHLRDREAHRVEDVTQLHGPGRDIHSDSQYRTVVRQEVRELQEREKRRFSLVIRGLSSNTPTGVVAEFEDVTSSVMGTKVTLTEAKKIPNNPDLWRAKILDPEQRKLVLDRAKHLRGTQYDHIYIRRDLTFVQRMELRQRRESLAQTTGRIIRPSHHNSEAPSSQGTNSEQRVSDPTHQPDREAETGAGGAQSERRPVTNGAQEDFSSADGTPAPIQDSSSAPVSTSSVSQDSQLN